MSTRNLAPCRRNLNLDIKMWYSDIDCQWHYTLLAYEDGSTLHSSKADTVKQALESIERRVARLMEEEAHEVQSK